MKQNIPPSFAIPLNYKLWDRWDWDLNFLIIFQKNGTEPLVEIAFPPKSNRQTKLIFSNGWRVKFKIAHQTKMLAAPLVLRTVVQSYKTNYMISNMKDGSKESYRMNYI